MDEEKAKKLSTAVILAMLLIVVVFCGVFFAGLIWLLNLVY